jgi:hypothetical protein
MSSDQVSAGIASMRAGYAEVAAAGIDALSHRELLEVLGELKTLTSQIPSQPHRVPSRLAAEASRLRWPQRGTGGFRPEFIGIERKHD